jgi:methylmalonyl-CoA mutase cobalamin-binding domain/chain
MTGTPSGQNRRPGRIVIGTLGLDQHEVGAMAISQLLARYEYEIVYLGRFNTPQRPAAVAEQEDADLVGVSVHSWEFVAYADELIGRCRDLGIGLVFGGSVLTRTRPRRSARPRCRRGLRAVRLGGRHAARDRGDHPLWTDRHHHPRAPAGRAGASDPVGPGHLDLLRRLDTAMRRHTSRSSVTWPARRPDASPPAIGQDPQRLSVGFERQSHAVLMTPG